VAAAEGEASADVRLVLLSPDLVPPSALQGPLPPRLEHFMRAAVLQPGERVRLVHRCVVTGYEQLSVATALKLLLPPDVPAPSAFEEVGHIIHLNLRAAQRPWGRLVGAVLLDKCSRCSTVVNKLGQLRGAHRTFALQLLAGEARYSARVVEGGAAYELDFSAVYWNSRLGSERARLASLFRAGDVVLDLCSGVGPIAVAAARAGASVLANDINPAATAWLARNAAANGVAHTLQVHTGDGAALARSLLGGAAPPRLSHVVCNLPEGAPELVGAALAGAFHRGSWGDAPLPVCHVYAFSRAPDPAADVLARIAAALRCPPELLRAGSPGGEGPGTGPGGAVAWTRVREVAPGKPMLRASFRLPHQAAFACSV